MRSRAVIGAHGSQSSPYALDRVPADLNSLRDQRIFFDGVLKGDYSLAIVNRFLARALLAAGFDVTLHTAEPDWHGDPMLKEMQDVRTRCVADYPVAGQYDIHLRNTWPPRADDMIGRVNAFVCFAWEEMEFAQEWVEHFNRHLDLVMVTSNFVERSFRHSGVTVPIHVVGNGCDHVTTFPASLANTPRPRGDRQRFLHVSSCFPRKGADVLLHAFPRAFREADPAELIIKTFANRHNTVPQDVIEAQARDPGAAPIHVITHSYPFADLLSLVLTATALVAPSRGEGFGLPMAEAMMFGVPVITTGFGGQTDFCTPETAWLIEHRQVPSSAHVAGEYSVWAEPSADSLVSQMRELLAQPGEARRRSENAKALLGAYFKWSDVAVRVIKSLILATSTAQDAHPGKQTIGSVDLVSTWDQVCGIATYAEHLCLTPALQPRLRQVLAREIAADARPNRLNGATSDIPSERIWGYDSASMSRLGARLESGDADVLWIQHHPGFFSAQDMRTLVRATDKSRYGLKAITLHNAPVVLDGEDHDWLSAFDIIFVHTAADAERLSLAGHQRLSVVPHGIVAARETMEADSAERFTIGTFGFLQPHKNLVGLVDAVARAREILPNIGLKALTCVTQDHRSRLEQARVESLVGLLGMEDAVNLRFDFLEDEDIIAELRACDLLCFPYHQSSESASGALRLALAADRPVLCSDSAVLGDARPFSHVMTSSSRDALAEAIIVLASHSDLRGVHDEARRNFVRRHSYERIAARCLAEFEYLAKNKMRGGINVGV